ncbi:MAG: hypothetical protein ACFFCS_25970 [Candidatus Hodarchaeota archaeon]
MLNPNSENYGVELFIDGTAIPGLEPVATVTWDQLFGEDPVHHNIVPLFTEDSLPAPLSWRFFLRHLVP